MLRVNLDFNLLTTIPDNVFSGENILQFSAQGNQISQTDFSSALPAHLETLNLQNNVISGAVILPNLARLGQLAMGNNQITGVSISGGANLIALVSVDLHNNQLTSIPSFFQPATCGQTENTLDVSYNQISSISNFTAKINVLNLSGNKMASLSSGMFNSICLTQLSFAAAGIQSIPANTFVNTPNLSILDIHSNSLSAIPALNGVRLFELDLSYNSISSCQAANLPSSLLKLNLGYNSISGSLGSSSNVNLTLLTYLILDGNSNLGSIDNSWISTLNSLRAIEAVGCGLTTYSSDIQSLGLLEYINFANNQINSIVTFGNLPALQTLDLSQNQISSDQLGKTAFDSLTTLATLVLNNNQLTTPYARWFKSIQSLSTLQWFDNPWVCDCSSIPFAELLENTEVPRSLQSVLSDTVKCTSPAVFNGTYIDQLGVHGINDELGCFTYRSTTTVPVTGGTTGGTTTNPGTTSTGGPTSSASPTASPTPTSPAGTTGGTTTSPGTTAGTTVIPVTTTASASQIQTAVLALFMTLLMN